MKFSGNNNWDYIQLSSRGEEIYFSIDKSPFFFHLSLYLHRINFNIWKLYNVQCIFMYIFIFLSSWNKVSNNNTMHDVLINDWTYHKYIYFHNCIQISIWCFNTTNNRSIISSHAKFIPWINCRYLLQAGAFQKYW